MQLRMRTVFCATALVVAMLVTTTAFAQVTFSVASTPTSRAHRTEHTANIGTISLSGTGSGAGGTTVAAVAGGTLTIDLSGLTITNTLAGPPGAVITVVGTGAFPAAPVTVVNNAAGSIVIALPAIAAGGAGVGTLVISGVRVSLSGTTITNLNASVSAAGGSGYTITAGQNNPTVVSSVVEGLVDGGVATSTAAGGTATVLSNGVVADATWGVDITENFIDAFQTLAQLGGGAVNDVSLLMTFSGLPTGVTLGIAAGAVTIREGGATIGAVGAPAAATTVSATSNTVTVTFTGGAALSLTAASTVRVAGTIAVGTTATLPLSTGTITVQVTLAPTGSALSSGAAIVAAGTAVPRFAATQRPATALTIATIVPAATDLLIPFASRSGSFDTGIAIANTTTDPFGTPNGAVQQSGTITFNFYPTTGSSFSYTTSATSPGSGLTSGSLSSGRTYSVLLSELLAAAQGPASFGGYVIAVANFTNAHGQAYVTDFRTFTSATDVLVIPPPQAGAVNTRTAGTGFESLGK